MPPTAAASRARQDADPDPAVGGIAGDRLRSIIERIERLEEERKALGNDIRDIYADGKSAGFQSPVSSILYMYFQSLGESTHTRCRTMSMSPICQCTL